MVFEPITWFLFPVVTEMSSVDHWELDLKEDRENLCGDSAGSSIRMPIPAWYPWDLRQVKGS